LNFEDNIGKKKTKKLFKNLIYLDGKFSSLSKMNIRLSRQTNLDLTPSRTISSSQYQRLIDFPADYPYYTLKVHFKRGTTQDYVMTSIPMVIFSFCFRIRHTSVIDDWNQNGL
jgi:hypothetical protein